MALHIPRVNEALNLWQATKNQDVKALEQIIRWDGPDAVFYQGAGTISIIASRNPDIRVHLFDRLRYEDLVMPARLYLQELINEMVPKLVRRKLLWTTDRKRMEWVDVPEGLIGFMWLSLADAIAEHQTFRRCAACGKPIVATDRGRR